MKQIQILYPEGKVGCLTLSYDDGAKQDRKLVSIFNRFGVKATFNVSSDLYSPDFHIEREAIPSLYVGHELACHSRFHDSLVSVPECNVASDTLYCRDYIEKKVEKPVIGYAYPFGTYNEGVLSALRSAGIRYARTTASTSGFSLPENFLKWNPTCHHRDAQKLIGSFRKSCERFWGDRLFYVWGHSFEFETENNWNVIEEFLSRITEEGDVWFATNGEVFEYVSAFRSLRFSAENDFVTNPSFIPVYIRCDGKTIKIPAGETVRL